MPNSPDRHFVAVWNPAYALDAMEQHLTLLLSLADQYDKRTVDDTALYIWWGKVRSQNRLNAQKHLDSARAVAAELAAESRGETQLYLTDYRSLYVAEVGAIYFGELPEREWEHAPAYYRSEDYHCDYWFKVLDVRRLVANDLTLVIAELKKLRNLHYHDKPVSLYGGMVDLPLFVTRPDGQRFFDPDERDAYTDDRLWAEFDADVGTGIAATERDLRDNLFGEEAWLGLEATARTFIATGEKLFREHRGDGAFDFGVVVGSWGRALEVQVNAMLRRGAAKLTVAQRQANVDGRTIDLAGGRPLTIGQLGHVLHGEHTLVVALNAKLTNAPWFTGQLPAVLLAFKDVRNDGVHTRRVDRATAEYWREQLLGVGCTGHFVELSKVRLK